MTDPESSEEDNVFKIPKDVYNLEMEKIKTNPREYICTWGENNLLHVGRKAFRLISLMPCSMIIPSIPFNSTGIRANINTFIIGSPASGKSSLIKMFLKFSYFPISQKSASAKHLIHKINDFEGMFSLGIDDFSNVMDQPDGYETIKILEGALGDEKESSHENMKYEIRTKTQAVGLICGTWVDLKKYANYLKGGLLSRMSLIYLSINDKQREQIADFINNGIGKISKSTESRIQEQIIKDYYSLLFDIQSKKNKDIPQVSGYSFNEESKSMALSSWKRMTLGYANDINGDFKREFHDFYRFVVSHCFLNVFNREIKNGIIYPVQEDYTFALEMMKENIQNKIALIRSDIYIREKIDSPSKLLKLLSAPNIREDVKNILLNLSPYGRIVGDKLKNKQN